MIQQPPPIVTPKSQEVLPLLLRRLTRSDRAILESVLRQRAQQGLETYGVPLMTFNGRDALDDALAELLDAMKYITQYETESGDQMISDFQTLKRISIRIKSKIMNRGQAR